MILKRSFEPIRKWARENRASLDLANELYEALPPDLQERWGDLKPVEFALLALAFPEELPPEARKLLP